MATKQKKPREKASNPFTVASSIVAPEPWTPENRPPLEPHQIPPDDFLQHKKDLWLLESGRGAGKTEACARFFCGYMTENPGSRGRIIAPTYDDAVESCVRGPSGIQDMQPEVKMVVRPGGTHVVWPNGSEALVLGTPFPKDVDRLRAGGNRHIDWWEEMAANVQLKDAWDQAALGLRLGEHPISIASSTPRSIKAYRAIRNMADTTLTKASMFANPHLPKSFVEKMRKKYAGTRLEKQEIYGELLEDVAGALWNREVIDNARVDAHPALVIIVVAIDPAITSHEDSDDTGIVAAGLGIDGQGYVLMDRTCHLEPDGWARRAIHAYHEVEADYILGETNQGGDMVFHTIKTVDDLVPFRDVKAKRGKALRAQPVAALFGDPGQEQQQRPPLCHFVGGFPELEDQLCTWVPGEEDSPDRLDAMVYALTDLMIAEDEGEEIIEDYEPVKIGADI